MRDATKGLTILLATLNTQRSRGWAAHNEFDYFTLCPTCGHWFDCRSSENLLKHRHPAKASIVVTTIAQTSSEQNSDSIVHSQTSPSNAVFDTPEPPLKTPAHAVKT